MGRTLDEVDALFTRAAKEVLRVGHEAYDRSEAARELRAAYPDMTWDEFLEGMCIGILRALDDEDGDG